MNSAVSVLFALVMLAVLVWAIMKKFHPGMTLWAVGTISLILLAIVTHTGAAAASSGNVIPDAFEYFKECCGSQFSGNALLIMSVMGYVGYMNFLKAGDLFAVYVARPLQKIQAKWIVVGLTVFLDWVFVMVLPSGIATIALLFGTLLLETLHRVEQLLDVVECAQGFGGRTATVHADEARTGCYLESEFVDIVALGLGGI